VRDAEQGGRERTTLRSETTVVRPMNCGRGRKRTCSGAEASTLGGCFMDQSRKVPSDPTAACGQSYTHATADCVYGARRPHQRVTVATVLLCRSVSAPARARIPSALLTSCGLSLTSCTSRTRYEGPLHIRVGTVAD
jgi:hypothetical protein